MKRTDAGIILGPGFLELHIIADHADDIRPSFDRICEAAGVGHVRSVSIVLRAAGFWLLASGFWASGVAACMVFGICRGPAAGPDGTAFFGGDKIMTRGRTPSTKYRLPNTRSQLLIAIC